MNAENGHEYCPWCKLFLRCVYKTSVTAFSKPNHGLCDSMEPPTKSHLLLLLRYNVLPIHGSATKKASSFISLIATNQGNAHCVWPHNTPIRLLPNLVSKLCSLPYYFVVPSNRVFLTTP